MEPVSLDVNKVCFEEEQDIPNTRQKSRKSQALLNGVDVENETSSTKIMSASVAAKLKL